MIYTQKVKQAVNLLGLHYYPDNLHYCEKDLIRWLPILKQLQIKWLLLKAPKNYAIPEPFIRSLIEAQILPVINLNKKIDNLESITDASLLFSTYARWGVKYIVTFDRPNMISSWSTSSWYQPELVERFLDVFIPYANLAIDNGLTPIFPPLEPGGDYWDITFLRESLLGIKRRGLVKLLQNLSLSAYSVLPFDRPLNWGKGGPDRWPGNHPYQTIQENENHLCFYIFDWYSAISIAILGKPLPTYLLGIGKNTFSMADKSFHECEPQERAKRLQPLIQSCLGHRGDTISKIEKPFEIEIKLAENIQACFFYCIAEAPLPDKEALFINDDKLIDEFTLEEWRKLTNSYADSSYTSHMNIQNKTEVHGIDHYLLLPSYEWGVSEWHYENIRPFVYQQRPTVGFSIKQAAKSARVTVVGGPQAFSQEQVQQLVDAGCAVERLYPDGTTVATTKANN